MGSGPESAIELAPVTKERAGMLSALHGACFAAPWPRKDMAAYAVYPACVKISANFGGELLGFVLCQRASDKADLLTLAVEPAARRRGIARAPNWLSLA